MLTRLRLQKFKSRDEDAIITRHVFPSTIRKDADSGRISQRNISI